VRGALIELFAERLLLERVPRTVVDGLLAARRADDEAERGDVVRGLDVRIGDANAFAIANLH
jgi:hypothetical protein